MKRKTFTILVVILSLLCVEAMTPISGKTVVVNAAESDKDKGEKVDESRFNDEKFYWTPQEIADMMENRLEKIDISITDLSIDNEKDGTSYIQFKCDEDKILITLLDVNSNEGYFQNIVLAGNTSTGVIASIFISELYKDVTLNKGLFLSY